MDPVTAIATATAAYQAIKRGFAIGKEVQSMSKDIGSLMNAINSIKEGHEKAKGRRFGSVEEEALETFAAKKRAEKLENELRNFLIAHYGLNAWQQVLKIQGEIRKAKLAEKKRKQEQMEALLQWGLITVTMALGLFFIIFVIVNVR